MKNKIIKTAVILSVMAAAGIFFIKSNEGTDIAELRREAASESVMTDRGSAGYPEADTLPIPEAEAESTEQDIPVYTTEVQEAAEITEAVSADDGRVNINTASVAELQTLSGIGEAKAQKIIEYRELHGGFTTTDEITGVSGIGAATYDKIKDSIKVK